MNDNTNFLLAIAFSIAILMGFHFFYEVPHQKAVAAQATAEVIAKKVAEAEGTTVTEPRAKALEKNPRILLSNEKIHGSIDLHGGRIDDLTLSNYRETVDKTSPEITLLSPTGSAAPYLPYYAEFGWLASEKGSEKVPTADTVWEASGDNHLVPGKTVSLHWNNGAGLAFQRDITLDDDYMFTVKQTVRNTSGHDATLYPFGLIARRGLPQAKGSFVGLHEGPIGVLSGQLRENGYKKLKDQPVITETSQGGWIGITDVYWLTAIIPPQDENITANFLHNVVAKEDRYQVDFRGDAVTIKAGATTDHTLHFFAGAKEVTLLDAYGKQFNAPMFDKAVDFGWFYFIAKPFFYLLEWLAKTLGNYGLAIICFTLLLRGAFYPLSETSYRSMARMKVLQPEMARLKERYGKDPVKMNEEVTKLYAKEKLNPLSGCLPMLIQIPVFFALYKVLLVSIEMRHAPFYGWIHDLSAPDPSNVFNLFGLLPFDPTTLPFIGSFLHLGAWPLLMGSTMFIQQRLSPQQPDKTTQQVFMLMPIMFTFLFASMSAGLVIYWTLSNLVAIAQQQIIALRMKPKKAT
jgi:YidC/Oxa1 family membrane protein insertase